MMSRTHEALRRAEANFQKRNFQKKDSDPIGQLEINEKLETSLKGLGLSEKQILNKSFRELAHSLKQIDRCIIEPKASLNIQTQNLDADDYNAALPVLIDRKKLLLNRFNDLVSGKKYHQIKMSLNKITDKGIKTSLEKLINDLYIKDKILKKEYKKLEHLLSRIEIENEQQKKKNNLYTKIQRHDHLEEKKEKPKKSVRIRDSLEILMSGILLICLCLFIGITPFAGILVPSSLNIAFFILLGFFFGLAIAKLKRP